MIRFISRNKQEVQIMEEWKIGEIRQIDNEWYQCIKGADCVKCDLRKIICRRDTSIFPFKECSRNYRTDDKSVIFKKLEKVGEPYIFSNMEIHNITMQRYKVFVKPIFTNNSIITTYNMVNETISIEIKNKGNMKMKKVFMNGDDRDYLLDRLEDILHDNHCLEYKDEICNSLCKYITSNNRELKPFDIEAAKAGKPVCTRDGRKARILCFDRFCCDEISTIVACVLSKDGKDENVIIYSSDGFMVDKQHPYAEVLMMLPEKKEGWINIYNADTTFYYVDGRVFETKDEAVKEAKEEVEKEQREKNEYIDTIRVEWEE